MNAIGYLIILILAAVVFYFVDSGGLSNLLYHNVTFVQCGMISSHGNYQIPYSNNSTVDVQCFYNAFVKGEKANLTLLYMGVDTGTYHNFSIILGASKSNSKIQDVVSNYSVPFKGKSKAYTYICSDIEENHYNSTTTLSGLLIFGCSGESNIFIPYR